MIRKSIPGKHILIAILLIASTNTFSFGNDFSCSYGKQGACLDYGDKICSSLAKCVSNDAVCFESYTCGLDGFICKSKYDDLSNEYDNLLNKCKNIATKHDELVDEYNILLNELRSAVSEYEDLESCVSYSSTLDEAKGCY